MISLFQTVRSAFFDANLKKALTQKELAEKIGATPQSVNRWLANEKAFNKINLQNLQKVCEVLNLELCLKNTFNL